METRKAALTVLALAILFLKETVALRRSVVC